MESVACDSLSQGGAQLPTADTSLTKRVKEALSIDLVVEASSFLRLLIAADLFPNGGLYAGPWAHLAVRRYCCHWLPLLLRLHEPRDREVLIPPLDVALVWALHRTSDIHAYVEDCTALAFSTAPEREPELLNVGPYQALAFSDGSDAAGALSCLAWPTIPDGSTVDKPRRRSSNSSRSSAPRTALVHQPYWPPQLGPVGGACLKLKSADLRSAPSTWEEDMRARLVATLPQAAWLLGRLMEAGFTGSPLELERAVERYCRFLLLAQRHQFETLLFPPDVLLVWWAHKAHSSAYLADMDLLMGCPFDPILPSLDDALLSRRTAELYEFEFGDSYNLCFLTMDTADSPLAAAALVSRLSQQLRPLLRSLDGACSEEGRPSSGIGHGSPSRSLRSSDEGVLRQPTVPEPQMQSSGFSGKSGGGVATTASRRLVGVSLGATVHQRTDRLALLSKMIGVLGKLQGGVRRWQTCLADPDARGMTRPPSEGIAVGKQLHQREVGPPAEEAVARASDFAVEAGPPVRLAGVGVRIGTAGDNGADTDGPVPASSATVALASGMVATVGDGGAGVTAGPDRQSTGAEIATAVVAASAMPLGLPSGLPLCSEVLAVFNQATSGCAAGCVGRHRSSTGIQTSLTGATLGNPVAHVPRAGAAVRYLLWLLEREYAHLTRAATVDAATAAASTSAHGSDGGGGPRPLVRSRRGLARMLNNGGFAAIAAAAAAKRTRKEQIAASKALAKAMARHTASFGAFGNLPMMSSHPFLEDCCPGAFAGGAGDSSGLQPVVSMGLMAVLNSETWEAALAKAVTTLAGTKTVAKAARKKKASGHRA